MRAVDGVSFQVAPGEFVGFLGPNGAGKTTVLKMLSGLVQPSSGDAAVLGFRPWDRRDAMKRQFALLMGQKNALWWDLPARESLELNRVIYGIERSQFEAMIEDPIAHHVSEPSAKKKSADEAEPLFFRW
jgi:ABC-2 type transport system ATP-binding protein